MSKFIEYAPGTFSPDPIIVIPGGGHGPRTIETEVNRRTKKLISLVGVSDSGGHTGQISQEHQIGAVGDATARIPNHIIEDLDENIAKLPGHAIYDFRFPNGQRPFNDLLAGYILLTGSYSAGLEMLERRTPNYRGRVIPISDDVVKILVHRTGKLDPLVGEHNIDAQTPIDPPIVETTLFPRSPKTNPEAIEYFRIADALVVPPGTLHANRTLYRYPGLMEAYDAKRPYTCLFVNPVNHPETYGWKASDHVRAYAAAGLEFDDVFVNLWSHLVPGTYREEDTFIVKADIDECARYARRVHHLPMTHLEDYRGRPVIRHDGEFCADLIFNGLDVFRTEKALNPQLFAVPAQRWSA